MNDDGYTFSGLDAHIGEVEDGVAAPMRRVVEAARPLDRAAYGIVGRLFADAAAEAVEIGVRGVRELADLGTDFGDGLRRTQETYLLGERANRELLDGRDG